LPAGLGSGAALASVIAPIEMEGVGTQLSATFRPHVRDGQEPGHAGTGFWLTPVDYAKADAMRVYFEKPPEATTVRHTFVNVPLWRAVPIPPLEVE
jgi:hypothetical protein